MEVKNIIKNCAILLDDNDLYEAVEIGSYDDQQNEILNKLVMCVNLINSRISTEYLHIVDIKNVNVVNGEIALKEICNTIFDVKGVKLNSYPVEFRVRNGKLITSSGNVEIEYSYLPENVLISSTISSYSGKVTERVFAYGVVAEYLTIKGNIDEANVWENKFVKSMRYCVEKQKEIVLPKRRWY